MTDYTPLTNRSEIVFLYDGINCNPNGNPLDGENRPRIDQQTQKCIVTDVRFKRYLRDQLDDDGFPIYVKGIKNEEGDLLTRQALLERHIEQVEVEDEDDPTAYLHALLDRMTDVRMFGATFSFNDDALLEKLNNHAHIQGPIQFSPATSLNRVETNYETSNLTTVMPSGDDKGQGTFATDYRIKYGMFNVHGIINENAAKTSRLTPEDVTRLDTLCWTAIKNQTLSRSKLGQEPHFYARVEYDTDNFHLGLLDKLLSVDTDRSKPDEEMRSVLDICVDVTAMFDHLQRNKSHLDTVYLAVGDHFRASYDGAELDASGVANQLESLLGADRVTIVPVEEAAHTPGFEDEE